MTDLKTSIKDYAIKAKKASRVLAKVSSEIKNNAILNMARRLEESISHIIEENKRDLEEGQKNSLSSAMLDRLKLNETRIKAMSTGLREIVRLPDPVGEVVNMWKRPNGLEVGRMRVPLGVIGIIYEARPNVTVDASGLCLKSGNAVILRGGSEAIHSNLIISKTLSEAIQEVSAPKDAIQLIETKDRQAVDELLKLDDYIDVIIPRGGESLIRKVVAISTIPVIKHYKGVCHTYVDDSADLSMAEEISFNAKVQRPGVCNAMETLLVHKDIASKFLPRMIERFKKADVEIRGCLQAKEIVRDIKDATEDDWYAEYLDLILAVKVVSNIDEAIEHIHKYGSMHSEAIITSDYTRSRKFLQEVDSSVVFVNASTRFSDGFEFGLGAEIGISTQKLHARGPMGLQELTCTKFIVCGNGQVRG
ncbi:MAG: glutamate-5-semialdehyde dehydrogenase [bacterium]